MSVVLGSNVNADGKVVLDTLPILEMTNEFPELDPGTDYTLAANRASLSLGPLAVPVDVVIEIPSGSSWVIL